MTTSLHLLSFRPSNHRIPHILHQKDIRHIPIICPHPLHINANNSPTSPSFKRVMLDPSNDSHRTICPVLFDGMHARRQSKRVETPTPRWATQVCLRGVKAGRGGHDAGVFGVDEGSKTHRPRYGNGSEWSRRMPQHPVTSVAKTTKTSARIKRATMKRHHRTSATNFHRPLSSSPRGIAKRNDRSAQ